MTSDTKGNLGLGKAISYFTEQGYTVSLPLTDTQCYDLIVEQDGILQTVQVRYTAQTAPSGSYICRLETKNSNKIYYCITDTFCDLLFCYCSNGDMYLIPIKDIHSRTMISLYKERPKYISKESFDSSKYLIGACP